MLSLPYGSAIHFNGFEEFFTMALHIFKFYSISSLLIKTRFLKFNSNKFAVILIMCINAKYIIMLLLKKMKNFQSGVIISICKRRR